MMHPFVLSIVFLIDKVVTGMKIENEVMRKAGLIGVLVVLVALSGCNYLGPCLNGSGPVVTEQRDEGVFTGVDNTGSFDVYVTRGDSFSVEVTAQENLIPMIETFVSGNTLIIQTQNGTCYNSSAPVQVHVSMPEAEVLRLSGSGRISADMVSGMEVEIANSGSGYMEIDSVKAETCVLSNSGSGNISVEGSYVVELNVAQSGSGAIMCGTLFGTVEVKMSHSSSGRISAVVLYGTTIDVLLSGSGPIELSGDVDVAEYSLNSSGKIDALDLMVSDVDAISTGSGNIYVWAADILDATITGSGDIIYRGDPMVNTTITGSGSVRSY